MILWVWELTWPHSTWFAVLFKILFLCCAFAFFFHSSGHNQYFWMFATLMYYICVHAINHEAFPLQKVDAEVLELTCTVSLVGVVHTEVRWALMSLHKCWLRSIQESNSPMPICMKSKRPPFSHGLYMRRVSKCAFAYDRVCLQVTLCSWQDIKVQLQVINLIAFMFWTRLTLKNWHVWNTSYGNWS